MNWLKDYQDDLVALEEFKSDVLPLDLSDNEQVKNFLDDFKTIFAPVEDGSLDPSDIDKIFNSWWEKFRRFEVEAVKKEVPIQHRLAPLYGRLEQGTEEEWEEYAKMRIRARLQSPLFHLIAAERIQIQRCFFRGTGEHREA